MLLYLSFKEILFFKIKIPLSLLYSAKSLLITSPSAVKTETSFSKIVIFLFLSIVIFFALILIFSAIRIWLKKKVILSVKFYFSFICKTPTKVKKLNAKTGDQIANTIGIYQFYLMLKKNL